MVLYILLIIRSLWSLVCRGCHSFGNFRLSLLEIPTLSVLLKNDPRLGLGA